MLFDFPLTLPCPCLTCLAYVILTSRIESMHAKHARYSVCRRAPTPPLPACRDGLGAEAMRTMAAMAITTRPDAACGEEDMTAETASVTRCVGHAAGGGMGWMRMLKAAMAATTKIDAAGLRHTKRPRPDGDGSERQCQKKPQVS